jgi:hypothetical protein
MRIKFFNHTSRPDSEVLPLFEMAASRFPTVTGTIKAHFRACPGGTINRKRLFGGRTNCRTWIKVRVDFEGDFPYACDKLAYFPQHEIPVAPYVLNDWREAVIHVAAHEFAHCTVPGRTWRKSRKEVYCENRATEVLEYYRTQEAKDWLAARTEEIKASAIARQAKIAARKSPERRIEAKRELLAKWERKAKLAKTKIFKLKSSIRRYEKRMDVGMIAANGEARQSHPMLG